MQKIILILSSIILTVICYGQTMFFDNLDNSTWLSSPNMTDSLIENSKQIPLRKMKISKDSLNENVTVWNFKSGLLTITYFNALQKSQTLVSTYKYTAYPHKGILMIYFSSEMKTYKAGITSTGNNAFLFRQKQKSKSASKSQILP